MQGHHVLKHRSGREGIESVTKTEENQKKWAQKAGFQEETRLICDQKELVYAANRFNERNSGDCFGRTLFLEDIILNVTIDNARLRRSAFIAC
jgi:hypothetical protein